MKTKIFILAALVLLGVELAVLQRSQPPGSAAADGPIATWLPTNRLPWPRPSRVVEEKSASRGHTSSELITQLVQGGKAPGLSQSQIEAYLDENHRSARSLLAAFQITGDQKLLDEAAEKFPNDPRVAFTEAFRGGSPEERREWLDTFKRSAPDNSIANYLAAQSGFNYGRTDEAWQNLQAASSKTKFQDYSSDFVQNTEEAYRAAGYTDAEAKAIAEYGLAIPQFGELKGLGENIGALVNAYRAAGDEASAQAALQMGLTLSRRLSDSTGQNGLLQDLTALAIQGQMLGLMDPNSALGTDGQLAKDQLAEVSRQNAAIKEMAQQEEALLQGMSEVDLANFFERIKVNGEQDAVRWAMNKTGAH